MHLDPLLVILFINTNAHVIYDLALSASKKNGTENNVFLT